VDGLLWDDETKMRGMKALRKASMKTKGNAGSGRGASEEVVVSLALHFIPSVQGHLGCRNSFEIYCLLVPFHLYHHFF
jgi:hypothetical protein